MNVLAVWECLHCICFCHLNMSGMLSDIPEDEARYWAKKLEQINAMRDQDVSCLIWFYKKLPHIIEKSHYSVEVN